MTGRPDWQGPPLTHGAQKIGSFTFAVAAGGTSAQVVQFSRNGYIVNVRPQYSGASGATPFCLVQWLWSDANPKTIDLGEMKWEVPVHASGVYSPVLGHGPVRGPFAVLSITNLDGAQPINFIVDVWETTEQIARDDWRDSEVNGFLAPPGFTAAPGSSPSRNKLASVITSLTANTTYLLPLYAGQAWLELFANPVGGGSVGLTIQPVSGGGNVYNTGNLAAATQVNGQAITLPREPCTLNFQAPATGSNFVLALVAMEYAS